MGLKETLKFYVVYLTERNTRMVEEREAYRPFDGDKVVWAGVARNKTEAHAQARIKEFEASFGL